MNIKEEEIWLDVPGYNGLYQVSNLSRIRSLDRFVTHNYGGIALKRGKVLRPNVGTEGYCEVGLCIQGRQRTLRVHRIVGLVWVPNPDNLPELNHLDGNKLNNLPCNLEWSSKSNNIKHAFRLGLKKNTTRNAEIIRAEALKQSRPVQIIDITTNEAYYFKSRNDACRFLSVKTGTVTQALKRGNVINKRYKPIDAATIKTEGK